MGEVDNRGANASIVQRITRTMFKRRQVSPNRPTVATVKTNGAPRIQADGIATDTASLNEGDRAQPAEEPSTGTPFNGVGGRAPQCKSVARLECDQQFGADVDLASNQNQKLLPLTVAQRGIWIASKVSDANAVFNIAEAVEIRGALDAQKFIESVRQITEEAEATRVNIVEDADGPHQLLHPSYRGETPFLDFSAKDDPKSAAFNWMNADLNQRSAIDRDPLWLCALIKISDGNYMWYHRAHHIIYDGFSGGLVARRLADIYAAKVEGRDPGPTPFEGLSVLIEHEQSYRSSRQFEKDRAYWVERTEGLPEPVSFAQARWPSDSGLLRKTVQLSEEQSLEIKSLASSLRCTAPQLLIALAVSFIYRTTGQDDLVLGLPVAARPKKVRNVPGMVANAAIMRFEMSECETLSDLVRLVSREVRNCIRHQQYRYEDLRKDLGLTGRYQHVARMAINIEPFDYDLRFGDSTTLIHNLSNSSPGDLILFIYDRDDGNGIRIDLDANPTLYTEEEMQRHAERLQFMIESVLQDPSRDLGEIDLLTTHERKLLLEEWQGPEKTLPDRFVADLILENAKAHPDRVAVVAGASAVTYDELCKGGLDVANMLTANGVKRGDIVAVALPRNDTMVIGFFGVLLAGAAILPLDLDAPENRLATILDDAEPALILANADTAPMLDATAPQFSTLRIDDVSDQASAASSALILFKDRSSDDPVYVIYTSGSTGKPNGVVVNNGNFLNLVVSAQEILGLNAETRLLAVAPATFDPFMMEVFASLCSGARIVIPTMDEIRDPAVVSRMMRAEGVTTTAGSSALWNALLERREVYVNGLTTAIGGDKLSARLSRTLRDLGSEVINVYGPTETTVMVTSHRVGDRVREAPPIGRPLPNTQAYVLDQSMNTVPIGIAGELHIGGKGVSAGYLNRPELNAERFVPDTVSGRGGRLFKTGDLVRWRHDGTLEFLGRTDEQVKINGFRIELGEVENALEAIDGVRRALVITWEDEFRQTEKRLIAYVAREGEAKLEEAQLKREVSARLPSYMKPSRIIVIDEFPVTRNGKIDKNALPPPSSNSAGSFVPPTSDTEKKLVAIICDVLELDRIGIEDSLFDLGCDSLTAVHLLVEIETQFSTQLSLFALLEKPTISNLALQIENQTDTDPFAPVFSFRANATGLPLFCIHPLIGISWVYANLLRFLGTETPVYGLQSDGLNGDGELPASIEAMAATYVERIRAIQPEGPYNLFGWSFGGLVAHEMAAQLEAAGETVATLTLVDAFPMRRGAMTPGAVNKMWVNAARAYIGIDSKFEIDPAKTSQEEIAEKIFSEFDMTSMPIMRKAKLDDREIQRSILKVVGNNLSLIEAYEPKVISSDITICRATGDKDGAINLVIDHKPGAWKKFTTGVVEEYEFDEHHYGIMTVDPLREIGQRLARKIAGLL